MNFNRQDVGNQQVKTRIILFQKPTITLRLFLHTAFKDAFATLSGVFTASFPHKPCPLICSLMSSRVGIAPGKIAVTATLFPFISARSACENEVNAPFVALYIAKYGIG